MSALRPKLTKLDQRVLDRVPERWPGKRERTIAAQVRPHASEDEVRQILRGLESIGRVEQRGGWWTQC